MYEIANEAGVDAKTAMAALHALGLPTADVMNRLGDGEAEQLRAALSGARQRPTAVPMPVKRPKREPDPARHRNPRPSSRRAPVVQAQQVDRRSHSPLQAVFREQRNAEAMSLIPAIFAALQSSRSELPANGIVVACFDADARPQYDLASLDGESWAPSANASTTRASIMAPMRALHRRYVEKGWTPPNLYIAVDVLKEEAWVGRSAKQIRKNDKRAHHFHPRTLMLLAMATAGEPPRLAVRAEVFVPSDVPFLARQLGAVGDRPEEAFLLHQELLALAIDSLDSDEPLDPLPVHLNGLWVFAKPVIMRRPDGSDRYVRAVWFRQGRRAWRIRTYAAGRGNQAKEVGERLGGSLPFVPVWQEDRPEQKLIAAIWALMAQGGVTETEGEKSIPVWGSEVQDRPDLSVVRVKAGTDHAEVYRRDMAVSLEDRPAWSVRGHWRRQPYPSMGVDAEGHVVTKMIWIASYSKGDVSAGEATDKVISVRV